MSVNMKYWIMALLAMACVSCADDDGVTPVALDSTTITTTAGPGQITLSWNIPDEANYYYVRVRYTNPESGQLVMKTASVYSDSMVIDDLLARYGEIEYEVCTVSKDGTESEPYFIKAQCEPAEVISTKTGQETIALSTDGLWATQGETAEGPIADLIDGNTSSFFHTQWSGSYWKYVDSDGTVEAASDIPAGPPFYIVVDTFSDDIEYFSFNYTCRNNGNRSNPDTMEVYVSDSFDCMNFDETFAGYNARLVASYSGLPGDQGASYTSSTIEVDAPFRYVWFKVTSITGGKTFLALSELGLTKEIWSIFDPEAVE